MYSMFLNAAVIADAFLYDVATFGIPVGALLSPDRCRYARNHAPAEFCHSMRIPSDRIWLQSLQPPMIEKLPQGRGCASLLCIISKVMWTTLLSFTPAVSCRRVEILKLPTPVNTFKLGPFLRSVMEVPLRNRVLSKSTVFIQGVRSEGISAKGLDQLRGLMLICAQVPW